MKLAVLTPVFTPYRGGIGVVAHANAKMARELGHDVTVFTPLYPSLKKKGVARKETIDGFAVRRLKPLLSYGNAALIPSLCFTLRKFDRIHLHYPFLEVAIAVLFARIFFKKKFFITYHMDLVGKRPFDRFFFRLYTAFLFPAVLSHADRIIVSSLDYARNSFLAPYIAKHRAKITVMPHSVDTDVYVRHDDTASLRERYKLEEDTPIILFVGGLDNAHYFKGVEYLLEAFELVVRMMEEARLFPLPVLILVGYGNLIPYYENIAGQLGIRDKVIFAGSVDSEKSLSQYYSSAWVTVLPSIDKSESFGIVLIESMACGTPVIASDLPGIRSVVQDGVNGYLLQPKDVNALGQKLYALLRDRELTDQMGKAGREIAQQQYSYTHVKEMFRAAL